MLYCILQSHGTPVGSIKFEPCPKLEREVEGSIVCGLSGLGRVTTRVLMDVGSDSITATKLSHIAEVEPSSMPEPPLILHPESPNLSVF